MKLNYIIFQGGTRDENDEFLSSTLKMDGRKLKDIDMVISKQKSDCEFANLLVGFVY